MKKIARQVTLSTRNPPTSGPITVAAVTLIPITPWYLARCRGTTMSPMMATASAMIPPAPMPWIARAPISSLRFWDSPESTEPPTKIVMAIW